jgi:hypothetical protein
LGGDPNVSNGGLFARFPGLSIPFLDWSFDGPEPTDTQFHTDVVIRQYDGFADFPWYPLDVVADLNAVLGMAYVHLDDWTSAWHRMHRHPRHFRAPTATALTTSSRRRTCRCSARCAPWEFPSR